MYSALRPYVTTGIAIVGVSVLVAAPVTAPPQPSITPATIAVTQASLSSPLPSALIEQGGPIDLDARVDDFTATFNAIFRGLGDSAANTAGWFGAVPGMLVALTEAVLADPTKLSNALSTIAYALFAMPGLRGGGAEPVRMQVAVSQSLLAGAVIPILAALARTLPAPLGDVGKAPGLIQDATRTVANAINQFLSALPVPLISFGPRGPGPELADVADSVGALTGALRILVSSVGTSVQGLAYWVGAVPAIAVGLTRAVVADPRLLPNALSTVVHSLVGMPNMGGKGMQIRMPTSLLAALTMPIAEALDRVLPSPIGTPGSATDPGLIRTVTAALSDIINGALAHLPEPIRVRIPNPGPEPALAARTAVDSSDPAVLPATVPGGGARTLTSTQVVNVDVPTGASDDDGAAEQPPVERKAERETRRASTQSAVADRKSERDDRPTSRGQQRDRASAGGERQSDGGSDAGSDNGGDDS